MLYFLSISCVTNRPRLVILGYNSVVASYKKERENSQKLQSCYEQDVTEKLVSVLLDTLAYKPLKKSKDLSLVFSVDKMSKIQKPKHKYFNKKLAKSSIDINLKGFLCSCNNREKECIKEAYNLLNKYADVLKPHQEIKENTELSIEEELKDEICALKSAKRFQQVESGAKNFLFIKTTLEDPVALAHKIVSELKSERIQQTRFLIRLIPIEITCKAHVKDIVLAFKPLADKYFKDSTTFSVVYNHRNNNSLNKDELIQEVAEIVLKLNPDNKVDLKGANISIVIEVIKGTALIGVVPDFLKFKKYNLLSITERDDKDEAEVMLTNENKTIVDKS